MSRNIHFTPQRSRPVASLPSDSLEEARSVEIDDQTYWTGKEYSFVLRNTSEYSRWNRIVITNLLYGEEYALFSPEGRLNENELFELPSGKACEIVLQLGGETEREPAAPKKFEIYVHEYATSDEQGQYRRVGHVELQWIPRPDQSSISLATERKEIRVRPWPWKQRVQFQAALINRSWLPVTAEVRALPGDGSKEAGLEGTQEILREPIAPRQEQPVTCDVTLEKKLLAPVMLSVDAAVQVPALDMNVMTAPTTVQIIPIPFLKIWQDWIAIGVAALLLFWLLFGIPPFVQPTTQIVLQFDKNLPDGIKPETLKVTLKADLTEGNPPPAWLANPDIGPPHIEKNQIVYEVNWGKHWKGLRWSWRSYRLHLVVAPPEKTDNPLSKVVSVDRQLDDPMVSMDSGIEASKKILQPMTFTTYAQAEVTIQSGSPRVPFSYTITGANHIKSEEYKSSTGEVAHKYISMETPTQTVDVNVMVHGKLVDSRPLSLTAGGKADFGAWNSKEDVPIVPHDPDDQKKRDDDKKKPDDGKKKPDDNKLASQHLTHKTLPTPPKLDLAQVKEWCNAIHVPQAADGLVEESRKDNALLLTVKNNSTSSNKIELSIVANQNCHCQIYGVAGNDVHPLLGVDSGNNIINDPEPGNETPVPLKAGESTPIPIQFHDGVQWLIVLAWRDNPGESKGNKDLAFLLNTYNKQKDFSGWTIGGLKVGQ